MRAAGGAAKLVDCPARLTTDIVSDKWSILVIYALRDEPCRHGDLVDAIGGVSRKVLTQTLRRLQGYGLVERRVTESPSRVTYHLTELGRTLVPVVVALTQWADRHAEAVMEHVRAG